MVSMAYCVCGVVRTVPVGINSDLIKVGHFCKEIIIMHYFVYDCNNEIVGNPQGYKTFRGAARVEKNHTGALWRKFFEYKDTGGTDNTVSRISQGKEQNA